MRTTDELTRVVLATVISVAQNFQQERAFSFHMLSPSFRTIIHRLRIIKSCTCMELGDRAVKFSLGKLVLLVC